jgi:hypothetical protein
MPSALASAAQAIAGQPSPGWTQTPQLALQQTKPGAHETLPHTVDPAFPPKPGEVPAPPPGPGSVMPVVVSIPVVAGIPVVVCIPVVVPVVPGVGSPLPLPLLVASFPLHAAKRASDVKTAVRLSPMCTSGCVQPHGITSSN